MKSVHQKNTYLYIKGVANIIKIFVFRSSFWGWFALQYFTSIHLRKTPKIRWRILCSLLSRKLIPRYNIDCNLLRPSKQMMTPRRSVLIQPLPYRWMSKNQLVCQHQSKITTRGWSWMNTTRSVFASEAFDELY
jgi:hypothetical protein